MSGLYAEPATKAARPCAPSGYDSQCITLASHMRNTQEREDLTQLAMIVVLCCGPGVPGLHAHAEPVQEDGRPGAAQGNKTVTAFLYHLT